MTAPLRNEAPFNFDGTAFPLYIAALAAYREIMIRTVEALADRYGAESLQQKFGSGKIGELTDVNSLNFFTHTSISSLRGDDASILAMMGDLLRTDTRIAEFKKKLVRLGKNDFAEDLLFFLEFRLKSNRSEVVKQQQKRFQSHENVIALYA